MPQKSEIEAFGERLREVRNDMRMSQIEFGKLAEASEGSQTAYEKGKTAPTVAYLFRLREHGVDIGYLLTGIRSDGPNLVENGHFMTRLMQLSTRERRAVARLVDDLAGITPEAGSVASLLDPDQYAEARGAALPTLHDRQKHFRGKED